MCDVKAAGQMAARLIQNSLAGLTILLEYLSEDLKIVTKRSAAGSYFWRHADFGRSAVVHTAKSVIRSGAGLVSNAHTHEAYEDRPACEIIYEHREQQRPLTVRLEFPRIQGRQRPCDGDHHHLPKRGGPTAPIPDPQGQEHGQGSSGRRLTERVEADGGHGGQVDEHTGECDKPNAHEQMQRFPVDQAYLPHWNELGGVDTKVTRRIPSQ